ncbi:hypothetical protein [Alienimonas californiensis]|uniref:Uncharacterized protein n=1 Tax=Alienimonas californiensis TaxID=2527989 RepID=A0A517PE71_9PLAN|nr:hypothetical protein [Alienimonas californiensis]QDT17677.1 hypothetical protein CA12_38080 [Alienimonas californiensis]
MRHHAHSSRLPTLCPLLAAASIVWGAGCAVLPESITSRTIDPATEALVQADSADDPSAADVELPVPPIAPPAEPLPGAVVAASAVSASSGRSSSSGLRSPATQVLIAEELALAPVQERNELAAEWAKLDEAMVEQVIRIRRMVRQMDAKAPALAAASPVVPAAAAYATPPAEPARVIAAGPYEISADTHTQASVTGMTGDAQVRPVAYITPAPPADRVESVRNRVSSLFPGLPPSPEPAPVPEPTPLTAPPQPVGQPTRVAEALPPPAALLAPGAAPLDLNSASPLYDPGPNGFGAHGAGPGVEDFDGRLEALEQAARRRADLAAAAVRSAVGTEQKATAERERAEAEIHLRLLHLIAGSSDPDAYGRALEAIPGLPPAEQEFWQHTFWALSTEMDTKSIPNATDRATHAVAALRTAAVKLSEKANLTLKDVNFCHRVDSFGNVQTFDRDEFTPNEPVLIYAAVENFTSERTLEGRYRTVLRSKVEIFRAGGSELVDTLPLDKPVTVDLCDNHRQDYFLIYELKIPARIGLGPHVLKLTVEDTLGNAHAETELNFTVK